MTPERRALAAQQNRLLTAIWRPAMGAAASAEQPSGLAEGPAWPDAGLQAYRGNAQALAERVFSAAYPVLRQCLGETDWAALARHQGQAQPPRRGDLAHWGDTLADGLTELLADPRHALPPWLPELARAEWRLHRLAALPDSPADPASLSRLVHEAPETLALRLAPGTEVCHSPVPIASLLWAHGAGTEAGPLQPPEAPDPQALQGVGAKLRAGESETALFWRAGWRPRVQALNPAEAAWFEALLSQPNLGAALDAFGQTGLTLDLSAWLTEALQQQWLLAVVDAPGPSGPSD